MNEHIVLMQILKKHKEHNTLKNLLTVVKTFKQELNLTGIYFKNV